MSSSTPNQTIDTDPTEFVAYMNRHSFEESYDTLTGYLCESCKLIWVGGYTPEELGEDNVGDSLSDSAEAFLEQVTSITVNAERDSGHGYCDCLICDEVIIDGYKAKLEVRS